jgi:hypothetical protein
LISVLLLTMASTGFVSKGYQKVYAAADFPTSNLGTKIRESINNLIRPELSPVSPVAGLPKFIITLTLSGFRGQTGPSVTSIGLECVAGEKLLYCSGNSNIVIPGIGKGIAIVPSFQYLLPNLGQLALLACHLDSSLAHPFPLTRLH